MTSATKINCTAEKRRLPVFILGDVLHYGCKRLAAALTYQFSLGILRIQEWYSELETRAALALICLCLAEPFINHILITPPCVPTKFLPLRFFWQIKILIR